MNHIDLLTGNTKAFAQTCFEFYPLHELKESVDPDYSDCKTWCITAIEWKNAISAALLDRELVQS